MKWALPIAVLSLLCSLGATPGPSSAPAVDPETGLRNAIDLMQRGKLTEAQTLLLQIDRSAGRGPAIVSSQHAEAVYAEGICYMLQKEYAKAHVAMERVKSTKNKERDFVLNDAKINLNIKNLNVLAVKSLDVYLSAQSAPDEEALDLFGAAIDKASQSSVNAGAIGPATAHYTRFNAELERTHPGMHHWGQQWISGAEYAAIQDRNRDAQKQLDDAAKALASSKVQLARVQGDYDNEAYRISQPQRYYTRNGDWVIGTRPGQVNVYEGQLQSATERVRQSQEQYDQKHVQPAKPIWTFHSEPIFPKSWALHGDASTRPAENDPAPMAAADAPAVTRAEATTLTDLIARMASEVGPAPGAPWTKLNADLGQRWLQGNVLGSTLSLTAKYTAGTVRPDGTVAVALTGEPITSGTLKISVIQAVVQLAPAEANKAAKLVAGKMVKASGKLDSITLSSSSSTPPNVVVQINLSSGGIQE